jgi:hypothetical protein
MPLISMDLQPACGRLYSSICEIDATGAALYCVRLLAGKFIEGLEGECCSWGGGV